MALAELRSLEGSSYSVHYKNDCVNQFLTPGLFRRFLHSTFRKATPREISVSKAKKIYNYFCALSCIRMHLLQV